MLEKTVEEYDSLHQEIHAYLAMKRRAEAKGIKKMVEDLDDRKQGDGQRLDLQLRDVFTLICCGVLATQKTDQGRRELFKHFGLEPDAVLRPPVYVDIILKCVSLIALSTLIVSLVYHWIGGEQAVVIKNLHRVSHC